MNCSFWLPAFSSAVFVLGRGLRDQENEYAHIAEYEDVDVPSAQAAFEDVEGKLARRPDFLFSHPLLGEGDIVMGQEDGLGRLGNAGEDDVAGKSDRNGEDAVC